MSKTLEEALRKFGARPWHRQMTWSAMADNGIAVITLWTDLTHSYPKERREFWTCFDLDGWWHESTGNKKRKVHIQHSLDQNEGFFRSITVTPLDSKAIPRSIDKKKGCIPVTKKWWKIREFDSKTGAFSADCDWTWKVEGQQLYPGQVS